MTRFAYCYHSIDPSGVRVGPLRECPACAQRLDLPNAISVELTDGRRTWEEHTRLQSSTGDLVDQTGNVKRGLHSRTLCSSCGAMLCDWDNVEERQTAL